MSSDRFLFYNGTNPLAHKRNVALALTDRAIAFTDPKFRPNAIFRARSILIANGYPLNFIDKIIKSRVNMFYNRAKDRDNKETKFISIPYIHGHSEQLRKILVRYGFSASFSTKNTLRNIYSKLKYDIDKMDKSNLVYKINCKSCSSLYIGTTSQKFKNRISQHKGDIRNKKKLATSLCEHALSQGHEFDFDNAKIINRESNYKARLILEMCRIQEFSRLAINRKTDVDGLSSHYVQIIKKRDTN